MVQLNEGGRAPRKAGGAGVLVGLVGRHRGKQRGTEPPLESSPWALATA
jgi:hypothetical protein